MHALSTCRPLLSTYSTHVFFFFLFSYYGDHRDLHSFPTRRSSDLCQRLGKKEGRDAVATPGRGPDGGEGVEHALGAATDRKSTRLNSSHVEISYAVFCLKKKKKKKK